MPFEDVDEIESSDVPRVPSAVERVLRKIFVEDWNLKLLSLAITLALWLVVTGQNQPVTAHANVQLNFIRPQSLDISNDPPRTVDVILTGSRPKLDSLTSLDLVATIDLSDQHAGERVLRLADRAQISLPLGVKVGSFQPSALPIRLEPVVEKQLEIEAKVEGKPADRYEVYAARPSKRSVTVRGPASHVNALQNAPTETIWVTGHKEGFTAPNVAIDISDPKVDLLDPIVSVDIEIGEQRVEKSFTEIPVSASDGTQISPRVTTVTVLGPTTVVATLRSQDLRIILDSVGETLRPRLETTSAFQTKVSLKKIQPSQFTRVK